MGDYATLKEFGEALLNAQKLLKTKFPDFIKNEGIELVQDIRDRVSETGEAADGVNFSPYSRSHKWKKTKYGKAPLGKKIDKKNFYFKGRMWKSFNLFGIKSTRYGATALLGFRGDQQLLADIHTEDEKINIAIPNEKEENEFGERIGYAIGIYLDNLL